MTTTAEQARLFPVLYLPEILATVHTRKALTVSADVHVLFHLCFLHRLPTRVACENHHVGSGQQLIRNGVDLLAPHASTALATQDLTRGAEKKHLDGRREL